MHPALFAVLKDWAPLVSVDPKEPLFAQKNGKPWTRKMVAKRVRAWGRSAGVLDCHAHRFRHSFATQLLEGGADIRPGAARPRRPVDDGAVHAGLQRAGRGGRDGAEDVPGEGHRTRREPPA